MIQLAGKKVTRMQCHIGFGHSARTGQDEKVDKAYMEVTPGGVYVKNKDGEFLVPYSNVVWCKLASSEENKPVAKAV